MDEIYAKHLKRAEEITYIHVKGAKDRTEEFHNFHEIIYLLEGTAAFISDNIDITLQEGSLLIIPLGSYHRLSFGENLRKHQRCVFHFIDLPEYKELISTFMNDVVVMNVNKEINSIFKRMNKLLEQPYSQDTKCSMMTSALFILLHEISSNISPTMAVPTVNTIIPKAIHYISAHISDIISVDNIANELNVSASTLAHTFKKEMQISIHQYILKKRLIMARQRILDGESPAQVALECGFNDYSNFYRRYKKLFNAIPSNKEQKLSDSPDFIE